MHEEYLTEADNLRRIANNDFKLRDELWEDGKLLYRIADKWDIINLEKETGSDIYTVLEYFEIKKIVKKIAKKINDNEINNFTFLPILNGSVPFLELLVQNIEKKYRIHYIKYQSYQNNYIKQKQKINLSQFPDVKNKNIIILDDILETGETLETIKKELRTMGAKTIQTCVLLKRKYKTNGNVDYCGKIIEDNNFLVGFGLDYNNRYRNINKIVAIDKVLM